MDFRDLFRRRKMSPSRARLEQAERELKQTGDSTARALLTAEIGQLRVEAAFDDLVASVPEGARLATARDQLRMLSEMLAAEHRDPATRVGAIIGIAIHHGAPIYNDGSHIGCAYIYDYAARLVLRAIDTPAGRRAGLKPVAERFMGISFGPIAPKLANQRAWELRHAFDDIMEMLQAPEPAEKQEPPILISYRRQDAAAYARLVFAKLSQEFGKRVFLDIEAIGGGEDFHDRLREEVAACDAMVTVIGPGWMGNWRTGAAGSTIRTISYAWKSKKLCSAVSAWCRFWWVAPGCRRNRNCHNRYGI
jgi:hypothetical protein